MLQVIYKKTKVIEINQNKIPIYVVIFSIFAFQIKNTIKDVRY